jgi:hypothetical protein
MYIKSNYKNIAVREIKKKIFGNRNKSIYTWDKYHCPVVIVTEKNYPVAPFYDSRGSDEAFKG